MELPNNGPLARGLAEKAGASRHRSVYLPLLRGLVPTSLEVFDFAEQGMVTGHRDTTTVATQALYNLNDPFVRRQSPGSGRATGREVGPIWTTWPAWTSRYRLTLGRSASAREIERAKGFLADFESSAQEVLRTAPEEREDKQEVSSRPSTPTPPRDGGRDRRREEARPPDRPGSGRPGGRPDQGGGGPRERSEERGVGRLLPGAARVGRVPLRPMSFLDRRPQSMGQARSISASADSIRSPQFIDPFTTGIEHVGLSAQISEPSPRRPS